jgi:riboflavin biosynthesis pyrimidine reductase
MPAPTAIDWQLRAAPDSHAPGTPDPARWPALTFPEPWPDRPWVFGVMVASANGVVAWARRGPGDDPVAAILGGEARPDRIADRRLMRYLRSIGDAAVGAQTVREQPDLVLTPQEPGDEPAPELYRFRRDQGLPPHPRNVVYSVFGRLPPSHPVFNTPGLEAIVVTTRAGREELERRGFRPGARPGAGARPTVVEEPDLDVAGLRRIHRRLRREHGVRYLACEGGQLVLSALRAARLLDEGIRRTFDFAAGGAVLVAEGRLPGSPPGGSAGGAAPARGYVFQRWRWA